MMFSIFKKVFLLCKGSVNDLVCIEIMVAILKVFEMRVGGEKNGCDHVFCFSWVDKQAEGAGAPMESPGIIWWAGGWAKSELPCVSSQGSPSDCILQIAFIKFERKRLSFA